MAIPQNEWICTNKKLLEEGDNLKYIIIQCH